MLGELAGWVAREIFLDRVDRHLERREERKGKLGLPVVTLVATVVGAIAMTGWLLLSGHFFHSDGGAKWMFAVPWVRMVLVLLVAYGLRPGASPRRGGGVYMGILLTEIVNLIAIIADGMGFFALGLADSLLVFSRTTSDGTPKWAMWALLALTVIGLVSDGVIGMALLIRRRYLD